MSALFFIVLFLFAHPIAVKIQLPSVLNNMGTVGVDNRELSNKK